MIWVDFKSFYHVAAVYTALFLLTSRNRWRTIPNLHSQRTQKVQAFRVRGNYCVVHLQRWRKPVEMRPEMKKRLQFLGVIDAGRYQSEVSGELIDGDQNVTWTPRWWRRKRPNCPSVVKSHACVRLCPAVRSGRFGASDRMRIESSFDTAREEMFDFSSHAKTKVFAFQKSHCLALTKMANNIAPPRFETKSSWRGAASHPRPWKPKVRRLFLKRRRGKDFCGAENGVVIW